MVKAESGWRWEKGLVDERKEHIDLSYGNAGEMPYENWEPIARIGKPDKNVFAVEWLVIKDSPEHQEMLDDAQQELDFYLIEKNEPDPWGYAIYHCNTGANMYSSVHWSYFPKGSQGERYASEVVQRSGKGYKKLGKDAGESSKYILKSYKNSDVKMKEEMETQINKAVFIRHKISSTPEILEKLWERRQIAIHYENNRSTNPDDYKDPAAKNALKRLHKYCDQGAVVGAIYRQIRPAHILVGIIPKGSSVTYTDEYGDNYIYKIVQLKEVKEISLIDYPLLGAIQPRLAAITGWTEAFDLLYRIAFDIPIPIEVKYLSPGQLEVICQEYLRMKGLLKFLLLPIGRNLQDIDIVGIGDDGNKVIAQVTHSKNRAKVDHKLRILEHYKGHGVKLIFFGPKSCNIASGEVEYIPIETIIPTLKSSQIPMYSKAIDLLFNK